MPALNRLVYVDDSGEPREGLAVYGRDRHVHEGVEYLKDFGREVAEDCLETLRSTEGVRVGAVYRRGLPANLATTKRELYAALVQRWEGELAAADSLGLVFMDGDGSDTSYRSAHRGLPLAERRVIEDAIHVDSQSSQLMQMADLVAWCAYATIDRHPNNEFGWDWYATHLSERDPRRTPQQLSPETARPPYSLCSGGVCVDHITGSVKDHQLLVAITRNLPPQRRCPPVGPSPPTARR